MPLPPVQAFFVDLVLGLLSRRCGSLSSSGTALRAASSAAGKRAGSSASAAVDVHLAEFLVSFDVVIKTFHFSVHVFSAFSVT